MKIKISSLLLFSLVFLLSCNKDDSYTITKVNTLDCPTQYNKEASAFMDKKVTLTYFDKSVKMAIEGQAPIFLKFKQTVNRTDRSGKILGDVIEYGNPADNQTIEIYDLAIDKNYDGTTLLEIDKHQRGNTTPCTPGPYWITTYLKAKP